MCKNLLRSDSQFLNYSKVIFPSNLDFKQTIVSEMDHGFVFILSFHDRDQKSAQCYLNVKDSNDK